MIRRLTDIVYPLPGLVLLFIVASWLAGGSLNLVWWLAWIAAIFALIVQCERAAGD